MDLSLRPGPHGRASPAAKRPSMPFTSVVSHISRALHDVSTASDACDLNPPWTTARRRLLPNTFNWNTLLEREGLYHPRSQEALFHNLAQHGHEAQPGLVRHRASDHVASKTTRDDVVPPMSLAVILSVQSHLNLRRPTIGAGLSDQRLNERQLKVVVGQAIFTICTSGVSKDCSCSIELSLLRDPGVDFGPVGYTIGGSSTGLADAARVTVSRKIEARQRLTEVAPAAFPSSHDFKAIYTGASYRD